MKRSSLGGRAALWGALLMALFPEAASADDEWDRFNAGGYFRLMTRPSFQGGSGSLGYWNLYGRLLNESTYGLLDLRYSFLLPEPGSDQPWAEATARIEGGSVANAHPALGRLDNFALSQVYIRAGNILGDDIILRLGSLNLFMGNLGLYDLQLANLFVETLGISARYLTDEWDILVGVGDSGYLLKGFDYHAVLTAGAWARMSPSKHFSVGVGGQVNVEPEGRGNRNAPHATPGVDYADYLRGEVVETFLRNNPGQVMSFPGPEPRTASSYKLIGYVGFGDLGPLVWNSTFVNFEGLHPQTSYTDTTTTGESRQVYVHDLTDERQALHIGNEMQLRIIPDLLDAVWAFWIGQMWDGDNEIAPSDFDRTFYSTVLRTQLYFTREVHLLAETSYAVEISRNGNFIRTGSGSVFSNTDGVADTRGFEYGDDDTRNTWQGKIGIVLNPLGTGIFNRPSLRILYGVQHSNQNNAFGNSFVETLDELSYFGNPEQHWHHVIALETEAWF